MTKPIDDEAPGAARALSCAGCGASLRREQRYCLECGARSGSMPGAVAAWIGALKERGRPAAPEAESKPIAGEDADGAEEKEEALFGLPFMPNPQVAALAILGLLAFGVVLGSAISPIAQGLTSSPILVELPSKQASAPVEEEPVAAPAAAPVAPALLEAPTPTYLPAPEETPYSEPKPTLPPELPPEPTLPPIDHVFVIVLADHGYEETFGAESTAPYLAETLPGEGELLSNYYAVAGGGLANEIAMISGQGPTPQTAANCPEFTEIAPGAVSVVEEQVEGSGCVYPAEAQTLAGQLTTAKRSWRAYVEGIGDGGGETAATCRHPALGGADPNQAPLAGDPYETWRNPFVYFHSLLDGPECAEDDVGLDRLATDLKTAKKTPSLSYIVPDACHDGGEVPCEPGQPAGLPAAERFLETVVPEITASPAYREGGLIAITSAEAPQTGPHADSSACCASPEYPNLSAESTPAEGAPASGPVKPSGGGGRVGMLLLSPFVEPGSVNESGYYNHFSLLRSIEELFGLQPLGYAANEALSGFDSTVYDKSES